VGKETRARVLVEAQHLIVNNAISEHMTYLANVKNNNLYFFCDEVGEPMHHLL